MDDPVSISNLHDQYPGDYQMTAVYSSNNNRDATARSESKRDACLVMAAQVET